MNRLPQMVIGLTLGCMAFGLLLTASNCTESTEGNSQQPDYSDTIAVLKRAFSTEDIGLFIPSDSIATNHVCLYAANVAHDEEWDGVSGDSHFHLVKSCASCPICVIVERLVIEGKVASLTAFNTRLNMSLAVNLSKIDSLWIIDSSQVVQY